MTLIAFLALNVAPGHTRRLTEVDAAKCLLSEGKQQMLGFEHFESLEALRDLGALHVELGRNSEARKKPIALKLETASTSSEPFKFSSNLLLTDIVVDNSDATWLR